MIFGPKNLKHRLALLESSYRALESNHIALSQAHSHLREQYDKLFDFLAGELGFEAVQSANYNPLAGKVFYFAKTPREFRMTLPEPATILRTPKEAKKK